MLVWGRQSVVHLTNPGGPGIPSATLRASSGGWSRNATSPCAVSPAIATTWSTTARLSSRRSLAREKAYCLTILYLKVSDYSRNDRKPFSDVFGAVGRAVIQEFASMEEIAAIPFDELVEFIDTQGKRRFPDPAHNARKLQQVARDS